MNTNEPIKTASAQSLSTDGLGVNIWKDTYWKFTPDDPWGCEWRCIYCGAGDDDNHSYSCATGMHADKRGIAIPSVELRGAHEKR